MPISNNSIRTISDMNYVEIFEEIAKRQILALMFHDHMRDLYDFLNLSGFERWHNHQYISESEEFINTKRYFMSAHNELLKLDDPGEPEFIIPENWYNYTRKDVNPQVLKQYAEISFDAYKSWEEHTKSLYESCSKSLIDMGNISDSLWVEQLIKDVSSELDMLYSVMLRLRASNYDVVYMLDIQQELHKKYS